MEIQTEDLYAHLDKDRDGEISPAEFRQMELTSEHKKVYGVFDKDGDRDITDRCSNFTKKRILEEQKFKSDPENCTFIGVRIPYFVNSLLLVPNCQILNGVYHKLFDDIFDHE